MSEYGITATELAVINFVSSILGFLSRPCLGYMADRYQIYREMIILISIFSILVNGLQLAIPKHVTLLNRDVIDSQIWIKHIDIANQSYKCSWNSSNVICLPPTLVESRNNFTPLVFDKLNSTSFNSSCSNYEIYYINQSIPLNSSKDFCNIVFATQNSYLPNDLQNRSHSVGLTLSLTFWLFLLLKLIGLSLYSVLFSLTDAVTFVTLGKERYHLFGFTRMFGSLGILVFSILTALMLYGFKWLNDNSLYQWDKQMRSLSQFTPCFVVSLLMFLVVILISIFVKKDKPIHTEPFLTSLSWLVRNVSVSLFLIFAIIGGFIFAVFIEYYFLILFQKFRNLPVYFPGLVFAIMTLSEMIFIGISPKILQHMNYEFWISISFLAWSIRWFCYIFVQNYWFLILIEFLHGPTFGLMLPVMMTYISKFATAGTHGRIQGLFSGLFFNIGFSLGCLYGGLALDKFGYQRLNISMTIFSFICGILYYPLQRITYKHFKAPCDIRKEHSVNENGILLLISDVNEEK